MTQRVYNFSPGPAVLPESVLADAQRDLLSLPGVGSSILEISHRSARFKEIIEGAESDLRTLLKIPDNYRVLLLQGGARLQFSMVPMNLLRDSGKSADFILTGSWSNKACDEARKEGAVRSVWDGRETNYDRLPDAQQLDLDDTAAFVHFTSNETIQGVQFQAEPKVGNVPLVCDASSDFLSRPLPIEHYGILYACAQKNAGPAGVTVVIIRDDLLDRGSDSLPGMLNYRNHAAAGSLYNTPPVFAVYVLGLVARWLRDEIGGLDAMAERNRAKAQQIYDLIDASDGFYRGHAQPEARSMMNVTFRLAEPELEKVFVASAVEHALVSLGGHRSVGGIRASIYNAMPVAGVEQLCRFMEQFRKEHKNERE
jgi:phosphoserine aminotransferase